MKKIISSLSSALILFAFSLPLNFAAKSAEFFTIGTGGPTGVYFQVGNAICKMVAKLQSSDHGRKKVAIKLIAVPLHQQVDLLTILVRYNKENSNLELLNQTGNIMRITQVSQKKSNLLKI